MRLVFFLFLISLSPMVNSQDITGTWEGDLIKDGAANEGLRKSFKMKWEIVQVKKEIYGIIYFYPQDTKQGDQPNSWYSWYGKQGKKQSFPFQFIQGRYIDGMSASNVYQFNVNFEDTDSAEVLSGNWFTQLEPLNTMERPAGFYSLRKTSSRVSNDLWLKRKEKEIIEKLEKGEQQ